MPKLINHNFREHHTFSTRSALWISIVGGIVLTAIASMAHVNKDWTLDEGYHIIYSLASNTLLLFLILIYIFYIIKRSFSLAAKYILYFVGSLVIAIVFSALSSWIQHIIYDSHPATINNSVLLMRDLLVAIAAIVISILTFNVSRRLELKLEKEQLETENILVKYEALENQMDPHFLFNSLNTLSGLIGTDDDKAQRYLLQLASTYRYIMQGKRLVTLDDELRFVDSYSQMMLIRYGKNLTIEKNINPGLTKYHIVPVSIQLLIENAIKHNVVSDRHPLTIRIETTENNSVCISNVIQPKNESEQSCGLGLANMSIRYQLLSGRDISIRNQNNIFSVEVPLLSPVETAAIIEKLDTVDKREAKTLKQKITE